MSFIYSLALVEEYSPGNYLDTEQSALSNGNHTHKPCLWLDKTTERSHLSRFGMTFKHLTENRGAELLTSFVGAFHAKTYQLLEKAPELMGNAVECGHTWPGSLAKFDPDTHSLKTAQLSLLEDLNESCVTLPRWGLMLSGECWELPTWERHTKEIESGFLPTPVATDAGSGRFNTTPGGTPRPTLALMARKNLWPTPTVCGNHNRKGASKTSGDGLATAVKYWPTPTALNAKETNAPSESMRNTPTLAAQVGGSLNPNWVEWLMGWPIGHTDLKPLEMGKFQEWQRQHLPE